MLFRSLTDASEAEASVLGAFTTSRNIAVLHCDERLMPKRRAAWAAWNVLRSPGDDGLTLTYWMNRLQNIPQQHPLFVTLNPGPSQAPKSTLASFDYEHPLYDTAAIAAQKRLPEIQGRDRIWFCGAWTGYGFHEDGLRSGLDAARALGGCAPWEAA